MGSKKYRNRPAAVAEKPRAETPVSEGPVTAHFNIFYAAIICILGALIYSNTFGGQFYFDDRSYIVGNAAIKNLSDLRALWSFFPTRFISNLTFAVNYRFNGLDVFGYHLVNLVVHLAAALAAYWLALLTLSTPRMSMEDAGKSAGPMAFFVGLVFVSHPLQTQGVVYIVQRSALMATLCYLAAVGFYVKARLARAEGAGAAGSACCEAESCDLNCLTDN